MMSTNHKAPRFVVFSTPLLPYFSQHSILKQPQPTFFPQFETFSRSYKKLEQFVLLNLYLFG